MADFVKLFRTKKNTWVAIRESLLDRWFYRLLYVLGTRWVSDIAQGISARPDGCLSKMGVWIADNPRAIDRITVLVDDTVLG